MPIYAFAACNSCAGHWVTQTPPSPQWLKLPRRTGSRRPAAFRAPTGQTSANFPRPLCGAAPPMNAFSELRPVVPSLHSLTTPGRSIAFATERRCVGIARCAICCNLIGVTPVHTAHWQASPWLQSLARTLQSADILDYRLRRYLANLHRRVPPMRRSWRGVRSAPHFRGNIRDANRLAPEINGRTFWSMTALGVCKATLGPTELPSCSAWPKSCR